MTIRTNLVVLAMWAVPAFALAQAPSTSTVELTFEQARAEARDLVDLREQVESRAAAVRGESEMAGAWPGPSVGAEWTDVIDGETEFEFKVGQSIPLDGGPSARSAALADEARAAELGGEALSQDYVADVAEAFYEALYRSKKLEVLRDRVAAVERTSEVLARRESAGDASRFELERVAREVRRLEATLSREQADVDAARGALAALLQRDEMTIPTGELAVASCGGEAGEAPSVAALGAQADAERTRAELAERAWRPTLELEAGALLVSPPDADLTPGYKIGFGLGFPFWTGTNALQDASIARVAAIEAQKRLEASRRQRHASVFADRCAAMNETIAQLDAGIPKTRKLLERAEAGYAAGELTLLELLDAQQAVLEERLELLDVAWSARRAQNAWTTTVGGW